MQTVTNFIFLSSKITVDGDCSHEIKRRLLLGRKAMTNLDSVFKTRDIILLKKVCLVNATVFPVVMDYKESWAQNWCFWTMVLEKTLESPLDWKEIKPVHPKGNQSEYSLEDWYPDAGKHWRQEEKGMTEDEMVGWHYQLNNMSLSKL